MKTVKIFSLKHGDIASVYTIDYDGPEDFHEGLAGDVVMRAKKKFQINGKQFILLFENKAFYISKIDREWKFYALE